MTTETAWDYIIVGAGSAGCVLAERLSRDPDQRVLLLEEGPADDDWLLAMPKGFGRVLKGAKHVHHYQTAHDRGEGEPPEVWMRGKTLGGSSSVNGMLWVRGQPEDYDRIEALGNRGWGWAEMAPHFKGLENHALGESDTRGVGGPVSVRVHPDKTPLADAVIAAGAATGLPAKEDMNGVDQRGVGYIQNNIDGRGRRQSAAKTVLKRARGRPNLRIDTGVRIERVLFEGKRAVGVAGDGPGGKVRYSARGEVIVSCGGLVSPKLLQQSGIGPAALLSGVGVPVVHDSPGVGENLREHFLLALQFDLKRASDSVNREYSGPRLVYNVLKYLLFRNGLMAQGALDVGAFVPTLPGANRPDAQMLFAPYSLKPGTGDFRDIPGMQIFAYVLRPESQGYLRIQSADPAAPALINPNYLAAEIDRKTSVAMIRYIRRIVAEQPLADFVVGETVPGAGAETDEQILAAFKRYGRPGYHATGTCSMGQGPGAVVDERLRVRGVQGLRVVDCSVFPEMISGNTNAPTMAMASRAGDLIVEDGKAFAPA